jgi:hypothetical protein
MMGKLAWQRNTQTTSFEIKVLNKKSGMNREKGNEERGECA